MEKEHSHGQHGHEGHIHGEGCGCGEHAHAHTHGEGCGCGEHAHAHTHGEGCGCGEHAHAHTHGEGCGCGEHAHAHVHGEGCGCGGHHHEPDYENGLTIAENNVLMALTERGALPVARFTLTSSKEAEAYAVAMEPVYIANPSDSLDDIKEYGSLFARMEDKGLIDLEYDLPLPGYPYFEYKGSDAWKRFVETAAEAKERGFTFDSPNLELGGIALTNIGQEVVERMLG